MFAKDCRFGSHLPPRGQCFFVMALSLLALLVGTQTARADQPTPCEAWGTVSTWKATFTLSGSGTNTRGDSTITVSYSANGTATLVLEGPTPLDCSGKITGIPTPFLYWSTVAVGAANTVSLTATIDGPCDHVTYTSQGGGQVDTAFLKTDFLAQNYEFLPSFAVTVQIVDTPKGGDACPGGPPKTTTVPGFPVVLASVDQVPKFSLPPMPPLPSTTLDQTTSFSADEEFSTQAIPWTLEFHLTPMYACQTDTSRLTPLNQGDTQWGGTQYDTHDPTDSQGDTIARWGCAMTCLTMAINYANRDTPGSPGFLDPGDLNNIMNNNPGDFVIQKNNLISISTGIVDYTATVASTSAGGNLTYQQGPVVNSKTGPGANAAKASATLDQALCGPNPHPIIVGVKHAKTASGTNIFPAHFVLVTGKDPATGEYTIVDPNGGVTGKLSDYNNDYTTRGTVHDPSDLSHLNLASTGAAGLVLVDPAGNHTGLDPASQIILQNIPQSSYATEAIQNDVTQDELIGPVNLLDVFQPSSGAYVIVANGTATGPYSISITSISPQGTIESPVTLSNNAVPGSSDTFRFQFSSAPGSSLAMTPVPGDRDGDGSVDCADLKIVEASFGKSVGQPGFDPRADANKDGVVNILDLSIVARGIAPGTTCTP